MNNYFLYLFTLLSPRRQRKSINIHLKSSHQGCWTFFALKTTMTNNWLSEWLQILIYQEHNRSEEGARDQTLNHVLNFNPKSHALPQLPHLEAFCILHEFMIEHSRPGSKYPWKQEAEHKWQTQQRGSYMQEGWGGWKPFSLFNFFLRIWTHLAWCPTQSHVIISLIATIMCIYIVTENSSSSHPMFSSLICWATVMQPAAAARATTQKNLIFTQQHDACRVTLASFELYCLKCADQLEGGFMYYQKQDVWDDAVLQLVVPKKNMFQSYIVVNSHHERATNSLQFKVWLYTLYLFIGLTGVDLVSVKLLLWCNADQKYFMYCNKITLDANDLHQAYCEWAFNAAVQHNLCSKPV